MIELIENCQLEWDKQRGVLYVQKKDKTGSLAEGQIDITWPERVTYPCES